MLVTARRAAAVAAVLAAWLIPVVAFAGSGDAGEALPIETHGFVSQGAIKSTEYNYLVNSKRGSVDFSEVGLNFTARPMDNLRLGFQLFSRRLGTTGTFSVKADWFYFDYHWRDWLGLRAGRVKLPFGLYNEVNDVDAARVPVLLPQSIYPLADRDFLLAQTGAELYGYVRVGAAGALDYRLYGGSIEVDTPPQAGSPLQITSIETPYVVGGRLFWETPLDGLRVGGSLQALRLNLNLTTMGMPFTYAVPAVLWIASAEYAGQDWLLAAEYGRWYSHADSSNPTFAGMPDTTSERFYALAAYRFSRWFQTSVYYSLLFPNISNRYGVANNQHDIALTFRFDINAHWLIKLEEHYMHDAAGLDATMNGVSSMDLGTLDKDWLVFLIKTTAYF
ncbi:MAG TPA: hypothetical protein VH374_01190 [Polyangia bacterium]|jgi:hypothetical protein|nr:hypothetical protein [Polyangia bacterium]